ncbi:hypothetical protein AGMMS49938_07070 [Fibrobacterales bacterium]|nr:hypothetical protein AGMMS49938_07070 [Fibrobacterales bacterium]
MGMTMKKTTIIFAIILFLGSIANAELVEIINPIWQASDSLAKRGLTIGFGSYDSPDEIEAIYFAKQDALANAMASIQTEINYSEIKDTTGKTKNQTLVGKTNMFGISRELFIETTFDDATKSSHNYAKRTTKIVNEPEWFGAMAAAVIYRIQSTKNDKGIYHVSLVVVFDKPTFNAVWQKFCKGVEETEGVEETRQYDDF